VQGNFNGFLISWKKFRQMMPGWETAPASGMLVFSLMGLIVMLNRTRRKNLSVTWQGYSELALAHRRIRLMRVMISFIYLVSVNHLMKNGLRKSTSFDIHFIIVF